MRTQGPTPDLLLRTFQPIERAATLQAGGALIADWRHVLPGTERAYARMVGVMVEHGIETDGRPPIWAWHGALRLRDAALLLDPERELRTGFAVITFVAPAQLVLLCDYRHWCEALMAPADAPLHVWQPRLEAGDGQHPEQACLPYLLADWVKDIKALPTSGWDTLDQDALV